MKYLTLVPVLAATLFAACASDTYQPYVTRGLNTGVAEKHDQFKLARTACYGFCPVYQLIVDDRDILIFQGERFVAEADGTVSKRLPEGSFKKLIAIAKAHEFSSFDAAYPNADGTNCPQRATDMPSVIVSFDAKKLNHAVSLYQGCVGFDGRDKLDDMILQIDAVLGMDDWIGPREDFYGQKD